uniref:Uncharacterized protein n=1 Tax=Rhizophora mucronata TaxID=61149 RepID=A0A2P2P9H8_RHIMU
MENFDTFPGQFSLFIILS